MRDITVMWWWGELCIRLGDSLSHLRLRDVLNSWKRFPITSLLSQHVHCWSSITFIIACMSFNAERGHLTQPFNLLTKTIKYKSIDTYLAGLDIKSQRFPPIKRRSTPLRSRHYLIRLAPWLNVSHTPRLQAHSKRMIACTWGSATVQFTKLDLLPRSLH